MSNSIYSLLEKALMDNFKRLDPLKQPKEKKRLNFMTIFNETMSSVSNNEYYQDAQEAFNLLLLEILGKRGRKSEKVRTEQVKSLVDVVMKAFDGQSVEVRKATCVSSMTKSHFDPDNNGVAIMTEDQSRVADIETGNAAAEI